MVHRGGRATLLAAGETWQVVRHYGWPTWAFWLLMVVMLSVAVLNTAVLMIIAAQMRRADGTEPAPPRAGVGPGTGISDLRGD